MKANFIKRLLAYFVDVILVAVVFSVLTIGISTTKVDKLNEQLVEVQESYIEGTIEMDDYIEESSSLSYDIQKSLVLNNSIYVVLLVGYFVVFQYLNKGQTIGKKLLKIKVVENGDKPSILAMFVRTFIINDIFVNLIMILLVYVISPDSYLIVNGSLVTICMIFIVVSAIMILYRKDKLGLHDMLSRTSVVEE